MLKVAIVGCGKIADSHALQIQRIPGCEIVAACDREPLMARQLCDRFSVKGAFDNLTELLRDARPDVVHITTPPQSHFDVAVQCLESGCHVYVEKPFSLNVVEARKMVALAVEKGRKLTVGHDQQFGHVARRMRALVQSGYLGGTPVHLECTWCYDLGDPGYARAMLGDKQHWVRRLPGQLLHNVISHGLAKIAEYLVTDSPTVVATGFASPFLRQLGEQDIVDELRVIITEEQRTTAYFTFSSQMRPALHQFCIYGPTNGCLLDEDTQTLIKLRGKRYKSYVEKFVPPFAVAGQCLKNVYENGRLFLARDFHMDSGKKYLIESFYRSITEDTPVPIPYQQILLTSWIMDSIFEQIKRR